MAKRIEFVSNYQDLSTDSGFQFEFRCDRCGAGYQTGFKPSVTGAISGVLETASGLFGGLFGSAAEVGDIEGSARKAGPFSLRERQIGRLIEM